MEPNETLASRPEMVAELAADFVAVEVTFFEEAQNGHVQHCGSLYRIDIAMYRKSSRICHGDAQIVPGMGAVAEA